MGPTTQRPVDFVAGSDYPSPVSQIIGLGYHDGVTDGVLRTHDDSVYAFAMTEEEHNPDGLDRRTFRLSPLPSSAFKDLVLLLAPHCRPEWPCWVPRWQFESDEIEQSVNLAVDELLARAGPPRWFVSTHDLTVVVAATPAV